MCPYFQVTLVSFQRQWSRIRLQRGPRLPHGPLGPSGSSSSQHTEGAYGLARHFRVITFGGRTPWGHHATLRLSGDKSHVGTIRVTLHKTPRASYNTFSGRDTWGSSPETAYLECTRDKFYTLSPPEQIEASPSQDAVLILPSLEHPETCSHTQQDPKSAFQSSRRAGCIPSSHTCVTGVPRS